MKFHRFDSHIALLIEKKLDLASLSSLAQTSKWLYTAFSPLLYHRAASQISQGDSHPLIRAVRTREGAAVAKMFEFSDNSCYHKTALAISALRIAVELGCEYTTSILIREGVDPRYTDVVTDEEVDLLSQNKLRSYPLYNAVRHGHLGVVELLLRNNADLMYSRTEGQFKPEEVMLFALNQAIWYGHTDIVEYLCFQTGPKFLSLACLGPSLFDEAVASGQPDIVRLLYNERSKICKHLPWRISQRKLSGRHCLLHHIHEFINCIWPKGLTVLHLVALSYRKGGVRSPSSTWTVEMADFLLASGASLYSVDEKWRTPLHIATRMGDQELVKYLLNKGASIEANDFAGRTPLRYAVLERRASIIDLLLDRGAKVDEADIFHCTALHAAIVNEDVPSIQVLLEHGANTKITNQVGQTPRDLAAKSAKVWVYRLVEQGIMA